MEEKEEKLRIALEKNLQKALKTVKASLISLETVLHESAAKVISLANLLEQHESCSVIDPKQIPFYLDFPDLKVKVQAKLYAEISVKQDELRKGISILKNLEEKLCKYHKNLLGIVSRGISLSTITAGSPVSPPLADMIDWLEVHLAMLHEQVQPEQVSSYYCKLHILDEMMVDQDINSGNLLRKWTDQDDVLMNSLKDTLVYVGTFLEEKR